jgi:diguanylate cyclase (GGDEF)-like protein
MKQTAVLYDPQSILGSVADFLDREGWHVQRIQTKELFLKTVQSNVPSLIFCDLSSKQDLDAVLQLHSFAPMVAIGPDDAHFAVQAMKAGALHYWPNPFQFSDFESSYKNGMFSKPERLAHQREGTLLQIIKEIALTMDLDGLTNILVDSAIELTEADGGAILLLDDRTNSLVLKAPRGIADYEGSSTIDGITKTELHEILLRRQPVLTGTTETTERAIVVPTWWKDEPLGELLIIKYAGSGSFTSEDLKVLSLLNQEIAGAVHNAIIHYKTKELTIKDDLTEAYNRRYFDQYLDEEFGRAKRYNSNLSLIFFDVDNLKEVNAKYGHLMGSKMLQEIAHRIILTVRGIDKVIRYGGDEFCIVLPETETQGAYQVADRIRNTIASKPFRISDHVEMVLTGSIGIASFPAHATTKEDLIGQADRAMFTIKNKSKNAIAIAQRT